MDEAMAATGPYLIDIDMEHFAPMEISVMPKKKRKLILKAANGVTSAKTLVVER